MENNKRFLGLLIGIIAIVMVGGAAWWGYTFFYPAPEAVYAQLRSAVIAGDKEKMKSFMDASALDPEAVKQFDKITPEELRKMADLLAPDISKFITISSDVEGNKLTLIKRFDKPSETKPLSTTLFAIQFVKQSNNRTYKIGRISGNSENTDSGDKKEHESSVQKNIRRLRREFSLTIEPSKLSLREQLEEASSYTTKPIFSREVSVSTKFVEAAQMGNHAAYVKTEQESEKEGLDVVVIAFNLENGEWDVNMGEGTTTSFFPLPSEEELKHQGYVYFRKNYFQQIELLTFVLMPNHFHLLLKQNQPRAIEGFMRSLLTRYSGYFNKKYNRVGHLLQDVYKGILINGEEYFLWLSRYIHRNPMDLIKKGSPLSAYPYSSYPTYLRLKKFDWVNTNNILKQIRDYKSFVEESAENIPNELPSYILEHAEGDSF